MKLKFLCIVLFSFQLLTTEVAVSFVDETNNPCVQSLSFKEKVKETFNQYKTRSKNYFGEVLSTKGLRLFLVNADKGNVNIYDKFLVYSPLNESGTLSAKMNNLLLLINPFRWVGATIKDRNHSFAPISTMLDYSTYKISSKYSNNPKQASGLTTRLAQALAFFLLVVPQINSLENHFSEIEVREIRSYIDDNRVYLNELLSEDYRYKDVEEYFRNRLEIAILESDQNYRLLENIDDSSTTILAEQLSKMLELRNTVRDSISYIALEQVMYLEREFTNYRDITNEIDPINLNVRQNISRFCEFNVFANSCSFNEEYQDNENQDKFEIYSKNVFDLNHNLYRAFDLIDEATITSATLTNLDHDNIYFNSADNFIQNLINYHNQGYLELREVNYLVKRDFVVQFNIKLNYFKAILDNTLEDTGNLDQFVENVISRLREGTLNDIEDDHN